MSVAAAPARTKYVVECPLCGKEDAALDYKLAYKTNTIEPFISCYNPDCKALGGGYIEAVGVELGCGPGASKEDVATAWVTAWREATEATPIPPGGTGLVIAEHLPSNRTITGWEAHLRAAPKAMRYLTRERGLKATTIRQARIGYGLRGQVAAFTLPVYAGGQLVNMRYRPWPHPLPLATGGVAKMLGARGRGAQLYPDVPRGRALLLCEGEFDALLARQHGLPAVTSTAGTSWAVAWDHVLAGCRVAVVYDAGQASFALAQRRARQFAAGGMGVQAAWAVDLGAAGLADGEDLTDWFVRYQYSAGDLVEVIRTARGNT